MLDKRFTASLIVAIILGLTAGSLQVDKVAAAQWQYWIHLPANVDGTNAELRCGYHTLACSFGATGSAIDWGVAGNANANIYFRGAGNTNVGFPNIGSYSVQHAAAGYPLSGCMWNAVAEVHNNYTNAWQMSQVYVHGLNPRNIAYLVYGNPTLLSPTIDVATMASGPDPWGCGWGGQHVHSYPWCCDGPLGIAQNPGFPNGDVTLPYPTHNVQTWAQYFAWVY